MTPEQRAAALRLIEFETLPRRLLDIACRVRVNECLFHDDEFVDDASHALKEAIDLLRELAAEPVQEPVAWQLPGTDSFLTAAAKTHHGVRAEAYTVPLYAAPQQRQPLTRGAISLWGDRSDGPSNAEIISFARAIERAHGITGEQE